MVREMKDSGVQWIGEIPSNWLVVGFRHLHNGTNVGESIDKEFWTADENDTIFYTAGILPISTNYKGFPEWKYTGERDLLLARNGTPYVYLPAQNVVYSDHIIRVGIKKEFDKRFIRYCLEQSISSIIVDTVSIATWSASLWNNQRLPIPSIVEQHRVADFLERECNEIDIVLEKTRASIDEYKKLKQSVITQAVTKGVRPNHQMKDSGIEWIGDIPADWNIEKIKWLFELRNEKNYLPLEEVNLISLYTDLGVVQHCDLEKTTGNKAANADGYKKVFANDIVVNIILCWMGAIGRSDFTGVTSPAYDVYCPVNDTNSRFYHYYFRTTGFSGDCYKRGKGIMAMRWRTYSDQFRDIPVVYPDPKEQQEIVDYLDQKCAEIDILISKKQQFLTELETYKKSLIYEYVTGKREVPQE